MDLNEFMAQSNERARRGRRLSRAMFVSALWVLLFAGFLFVAAPNGPSAMMADPGPIGWIVSVAGVVGLVVGLLWMVRILRAKPEPDTSAWRYRDR
jgi:membrane associated rhomboid family serine protease